ncbi:hypothetical protein B6S12_06615 [Helicobacter valdiviensis]|uniref:Nucleobase:cation symporter n=1 Tax=Helicobacter valdiviensis TaxID=1458358 RepID=A0A2W6MVD5_9HELI|nr:type VI secretion system domain-containing protein [Helicobacter valdiviensis]PZT47909.1 hypothetical protein B6S12_06615 [Helicobacter valdiviensis]
MVLFSNNLFQDLSNLEEFNLLEDEMSKYKTLNHEKINWDIVYNNSLDILKNTALDTKACHYFILACLNLNKTHCFDEISNLLIFLKDFLQNNPHPLENKNLNNLKIKLKNIISTFTLEANRLELLILPNTSETINQSLTELSNIIDYNFTPLKTPQTPTQTLSQQHTTHNKSTSISINSLDFNNLTTLDDRKYRELYSNLSLTLLENDLNNLNAYTFFFEAMWGRIKKLPSHQDNITQIRYPNNTLINLLQNPKETSSDFEQIQNFITNLILNPFWFEGLQLFCELLNKQKRENIYKIFKIFVSNFLNKFPEITKLKFENGDLLCSISTYHYFTKYDNLNLQQDSPEQKPHTTPKNFEEAFLKINKENSNNTLFSNIHSLIEMAQIFEEKEMKQNANILYLLLKEKLENTFLKDYLEEYYLFIQGKINNF